MFSSGGPIRLLLTGLLCVAACRSDGEDLADTPSSMAAATERVPAAEATVSRSVEAPSRPVEALASIPIAAEVGGGLVTEDAVWAAVGGTDALYGIDPATNGVVQEVAAPGLGFRFDIGHGAAWVSDFEGSIVRRIDLATGTVVAEIPTGLNPPKASPSATMPCGWPTTEAVPSPASIRRRTLSAPLSKSAWRDPPVHRASPPRKTASGSASPTRGRSSGSIPRPTPW